LGVAITALLQGRARVRAAYFHNQYEDLVEFLSKTQLPQAGVSPLFWRS
jgi:hypothetical protein